MDMDMVTAIIHMVTASLLLLEIVSHLMEAPALAKDLQVQVTLDHHHQHHQVTTMDHPHLLHQVTTTDHPHLHHQATAMDLLLLNPAQTMEPLLQDLLVAVMDHHLNQTQTMVPHLK
jgi:hypothetical protein